MKIGIDAKRVFKNGTGLGVYGRNLIQGIIKNNTSHNFSLFTPNRESSHFDISKLTNNFEVIEKNSFSSYYWRTLSITKQIEEKEIDVYHGLSNELPYFINKLKTKSIVDIHDLCFLRFPQDYSKIDQKIFYAKAKRAARISDKIIATSEATKIDILSEFRVPEKKIQVIYQSCSEIFYQQLDKFEKEAVRKKHQLPEDFILSVGTIQGRKNQKVIVHAMSLIPQEDQRPIVLVGSGNGYLQELIALASDLKIRVLVKKNIPFKDLPAIYQLAKLFVFPSKIEGFGIPVLEAMASKTLTLTTEGSSMKEIIKDENLLFPANDVKALAEKINYHFSGNNTDIVENNFKRAREFSSQKFAAEVLEVYQGL